MRNKIIFLITSFLTFSVFAQNQNTQVFSFKHVDNQLLSANSKYFNKPFDAKLKPVDTAALTQNKPLNIKSVQNGAGTSSAPKLKAQPMPQGVALKTANINIQSHYKGGPVLSAPKPQASPLNSNSANATVNSKPLGIDGRNIK